LIELYHQMQPILDYNYKLLITQMYNKHITAIIDEY
jgi:hypothetical protein